MELHKTGGKCSVVRGLSLFAATALFAGHAFATGFTWKSAVSGNWEDPSKWSGGDGTDYPDDTSDTVSFPSGSYTVTLNDDCTVGSSSFSKSANVVIELGGHTLTVNQTTEERIYDSYTTTLWPSTYKTPTFRNGTLTFTGGKGFIFGYNGNSNAGGFTLDNATSNLKHVYNKIYGPPRIVLKNGAVWNVSTSLFYQYNQKAGSGDSHGFVLVTGAGTKLDFSSAGSSFGVVFNENEGGLFVQDGGEADFVHVSVGGSHRDGAQQNFSTNSFIEVSNATVSVSKSLILGGYYHGAFTEHNNQFGPTVRVKGANPSVTVGENLYVYDGVAAKFEYHVPSEGWASAPIQAKTLTVAARNADYVYSGTTTNMVWAFNWMTNHPKETVTLMELENPNAAALADFAANAVVADYDESVFSSEPSVTVSPDGTRLLLTAPKVKSPLGFMLIVK